LAFVAKQEKVTLSSFRALLSFREFFKTVLDRIASQTIAACAASVAPSIFMITRIYNQPSVSHSLWFPD
jgi:hypothetical protein